MAGPDRSLEDDIATREPFLRSILEEPKRKSELGDATDASRSTVDRAIRDLVGAGLIERRGDEYRAAVAGRTVLQAVERYHRRLREVEDGIDVLRRVSADVDIADQFLDGASVSRPSPEVPDGMMQRVFDSLEPAEEVYCVTPIVLSGHIDQFREAAIAGEAPTSMVIDHAVVDQLLGASEARSEFLTAVDDDGLELYRADVSLSYSLWITHEEAGIVLYSDTGMRGIVVNDTEAALEWATAQYERFAEAASRSTHRRRERIPRTFSRSTPRKLCPSRVKAVYG
jgi:predicted transcriptional regulator